MDNHTDLGFPILTLGDSHSPRFIPSLTRPEMGPGRDLPRARGAHTGFNDPAMGTTGHSGAWLLGSLFGETNHDHAADWIGRQASAWRGTPMEGHGIYLGSVGPQLKSEVGGGGEGGRYKYLYNTPPRRLCRCLSHIIVFDEIRLQACCVVPCPSLPFVFVFRATAGSCSRPRC